jgi:hypothetical protein
LPRIGSIAPALLCLIVAACGWLALSPATTLPAPPVVIAGTMTALVASRPSGWTVSPSGAPFVHAVSLVPASRHAGSGRLVLLWTPAGAWPTASAGLELLADRRRGDCRDGFSREPVEPDPAGGSGAIQVWRCAGDGSGRTGFTDVVRVVPQGEGAFVGGWSRSHGTAGDAPSPAELQEARQWLAFRILDLERPTGHDPEPTGLGPGPIVWSSLPAGAGAGLSRRGRGTARWST